VIGVDVSRAYPVDDPEARPAGGRAADPGLASALARAREAELAVAAHCGWYDGRAELEEALGWGATRIGHGTPLVAAPDLVGELSRRGVTVEVCPTAFERRTGRRLKELPVEEWLAAGIGVEVGTDHPLALGTDLRTEARKLGEAFPGWHAPGAPGM
jgi:adenosine deaminase